MTRYKSRGKPRSFLRKLVDYLATGLFFTLIALAAAFFANLTSDQLVGSFKVVDGDTLLLDDEKLRLEGIDAPEWLQTCQIDQNGRSKNWACGKKSTSFLRKLVVGKQVVCKTYGVDKYARPLVRCSANGKDINAEMVAAGWAVSFGDYYQQQAKAKNNKLGIWQGRFDLPQEWRQIHTSDVDNGSIIANWSVKFKNWLGSFLSDKD